MVIIIHHASAWEQAKKKFRFEEDEPLSYPVLVTLKGENDEEDNWVTYDAGVSIVSPDQAAKLLSACTEERILAIPIGIRKALAEALPKKKESLIKVSPLETPKPVETSATVVAIDMDGHPITYSFSTTQGMQIGDVITLNGKNYTITQLGGKLVANDPITGLEAVLEATDPGEPKSTIPGLEEIPIDLDKVDAQPRIADLGNPLEHVLDTERAV